MSEGIPLFGVGTVVWEMKVWRRSEICGWMSQIQEEEKFYFVVTKMVELTHKEHGLGRMWET